MQDEDCINVSSTGWRKKLMNMSVKQPIRLTAVNTTWTSRVCQRILAYSVLRHGCLCEAVRARFTRYILVIRRIRVGRLRLHLTATFSIICVLHLYASWCKRHREPRFTSRFTFFYEYMWLLTGFIVDVRHIAHWTCNSRGSSEPCSVDSDCTHSAAAGSNRSPMMTTTTTIMMQCLMCAEPT